MVTLRSSGMVEAAPGAPIPRVLGRIRGARPGPLLVIAGGVHGNEPAGVCAAARVLARLEAAAVPLRGDVVALAGNVRALAAGRRYLARDLNRMWSAAALAAPPPAGAETIAEHAERVELRAALDEALAAARGPVHFLDLHTTSADGIPFTMTGDTLRHRAFAARFPLPLILGLEEQIDGVLSEYLSARGAVTMAVEGGQHDRPASAEHLEAVLWVALAAAGLASPSSLPVHDQAVAQLERARGALPHAIEILAGHRLHPGDEFRMEPGFANIGPVRAGELLARDRHGEIRAPGAGILLMPLYQAQGEDGFFFGRGIAAWELRAAVWARRAGLDALLGGLPGVRRARACAHAERLELAPSAAALYPPAVFRWFGYRRVARREGGVLELRRRAVGPRVS
jgi:predicted deacylase